MSRYLFRVGTSALPIYSPRNDALFLSNQTPKQTPANAGCGNSVDGTARHKGLAKGVPKRLVRLIVRPFPLLLSSVFCSCPLRQKPGKP